MDTFITNMKTTGMNASLKYQKLIRLPALTAIPAKVMMQTIHMVPAAGMSLYLMAITLITLLMVIYITPTVATVTIMAKLSLFRVSLI